MNTEIKKNKVSTIWEVIIDIIIYAVCLMLASSIFDGFYIANVWYAVLASIIISILNATLKPLLVFITLPITVVTLGIFYPIINVIVLKVCAFIVGSNFVIDGLIGPFFIVLFISFVKMLLSNVILYPIIERKYN